MTGPTAAAIVTSPHASPRRVFQVVWGFERFGGLERHLAELSIALHAHGTEVLVFTEAAADPRNAYVQRLRSSGIVVSGANASAALAERLGRLPLGTLRPALRKVARVVQRMRPAERPGQSVPSPDEAVRRILAERHHHPATVDLFARLDTAVAHERPDVVHVHGTQLRQSWVVAWAAARGLPTMYTEQVTIDEWGGPTEPTAVATMIADAGVIACVSDRARASAAQVLQGARTVAVVNQPVPGSSTQAPISTTGPLRLLCVARLERYKGIDVLLQAAATARAAGVDFQLQLAGDGSERGALTRLAQRLQLTDVVFLGAVPPDEVAAALQTADVMVLPSRGEGLPVSVVEAMAGGRPVLATRAGGTGEVVQDGVTGLLVEPDRPDQLADALARLAADRVGLQRMANAAREAWATGGWSPDAVRARVITLYREAAVWSSQRHG
ncbi:MAG: glycosyltransferase family 4 protein [Gemmatimonadaceae bacterium]